MSVFTQEGNAELVEKLFFLCPNCFLNVFCLHGERKGRDHIHGFACMHVCIPLLSSVNDRDVRKMGPSASAKQTEQKKKKKKDLSSTIFLLL